MQSKIIYEVKLKILRLSLVSKSQEELFAKLRGGFVLRKICHILEREIVLIILNSFDAHISVHLP